MITIIDYGMGNLFSVGNALKTLGAEVVISSKAEDIRAADKIVLPGVGAFPDGMKNLKDLGIDKTLAEEVLVKKKPLLGICLGMQLLATVGEEHESTDGLGFIEGTVRKFKISGKKFRIPHIGWNDVVPKGDDPLFKKIRTPIFYFDHSYHFVPKDGSTVIATCDHGEVFAAAVRKENIFGVQFHPEKSQREGLDLLNSFLRL